MDNLPEEWRPIPSVGGRYAASSRGRIRREAPGRRTRAGTIVKGSTDTCGYLRIRPFPRPDRRFVSIHRLVAEAFLGPCPDGWEVNHVDGDRQNNAPHNLEYVSHGQNIKHSFAIENRTNVGVRNPRARLTPDDVREIRRHGKGVTNRALAKRYGVSESAVSEIRRRVRWAHVD